MSNKREYTQDEKAIMWRARRADDTKHGREQDFIRAVYAQSFDGISPVDAARNIKAAHDKMIEARKEHDAAMTAYQEMINYD